MSHDRPTGVSSPSIPDGASPPLLERISFLIHRVDALIGQVANRFFRAHDLDLFSSRILVCLLERTEMRVGELVEVMVLPQSTISHQLQRLEKRKLIRRRRSREDNRSVTVALTAHGATVADACNQMSLRVYDGMMSGLPAQEVEQLRALLHALFQTLSEFRDATEERAEDMAERRKQAS